MRDDTVGRRSGQLLQRHLAPALIRDTRVGCRVALVNFAFQCYTNTPTYTTRIPWKHGLEGDPAQEGVDMRDVAPVAIQRPAHRELAL